MLLLFLVCIFNVLQVSKYKLKLFHGSKVCFLGFPEEEKNHMIEVLKENGGEPVDLTDITCTHMVSEVKYLY